MSIIPNQKYGFLTTIVVDGKDKYGNIKWKCLCDCGKEVSVRGNSLLTGNTTSCGCKRKLTYRQRADSLIGKIFGNLKVISLNEEVTVKRQSTAHQKFYNCKCNCGNTCVVGYSELKHKIDCGCGEKLRRQRRIRKPIPIGSRFGRLTVVGINEEVTVERKREVYYDCICDCGNRTIVARYALTMGKTRSCGCLVRQNCSKISRQRVSNDGGSVSKWETELIEYIKQYVGDKGNVISQLELPNTISKSKNLHFWYDCAIMFNNGNKIIIEFNGSCWHSVNPYQKWKSKKGNRTAGLSYENDFIKRIVAESFGYNVFYFWDTNQRKQLKELLTQFM